MSSENLTDASVMQRQRSAVEISSPPPPSRGIETATLSQGIEGSNPCGIVTAPDDKIKSERVRRLRDRIMGRE